MKCDCKRRIAILTCVACHRMLCSYCIQFDDHSCTKLSEKIESDKEMFKSLLLKNGLQESKVQRI